MTTEFRTATPFPDVAQSNRKVLVRRRAGGSAIPGPECFEVVDAAIPPVGDGEVLLRTLLVGVEPAVRGWIDDNPNYQSIPIGAVVRATGIGRVVESRHPSWQPGQLVYGWLGWQQWTCMPGEQLFWSVDENLAPPEAWLGPLGLNGLTAWIGLQQLASPQAGQTVLVSTAAGGVGSAAGQIATSVGARAVGLTGDAYKVALCEREFGYGTAIDYHRADLGQALEQACPNGIDIFFDNVAGAVADAVFPLMNVGGLVLQCGTAGNHTWNPVPNGPRRERLMLTKRLSWRGFITPDYRNVLPDGLAALTRLYAAGKLQGKYQVLEGLDQAPAAVGQLYRSENRGRLMVRT